MKKCYAATCKEASQERALRAEKSQRESKREPERASESLRGTERARESQGESVRASENLRETERARESQGENQKEQGKRVYQALHIISKERLFCCKTFKHVTFCHKNVFYMLRAGEKVKI